MGGTTNMISPTGQAVAVPDEAYAHALDSGYREESGAEGAARAQHEGDLANYSGVASSLKAGVLGALRVASLGLSDVAYGDGKELSLLREAHPTASTIGETAAMLLAPDGTPAGLASDAGAALREGKGLAGAIKGAALEGAAYNTGSYISDVALGDKDLSAEGFVGSLGMGALFGGAAGGALHGVSGGLIAARRLFPRSAVGDAGAVEVAERDAAQRIGDAADLSGPLSDAATEHVRQITYGAKNIASDGASAILALRGQQAAQRAETGQALAGLADAHGAAADMAQGVPAEVLPGVQAAQAATGQSADALAAAHDQIARRSIGADLAADGAHAAIASHVEGAVGSAAADAARIRRLADDVRARADDVRALLARDRPQIAGVDPFALPPTGRQDLVGAYDEAISRAAGTFHRLDTEAAIADAAGVEGQMFDDALGAGGAQARRAREILEARGDAGVDGHYAAARRLERYGTHEHVTAADEVARSMSDLGGEAAPEAVPTTLEEALRATKAKVDAGEPIGGMASRAGKAGGRFVGDAEEAIGTIGGYEKAVADLARELGPAAPPEAQQLLAAYDRAVDEANAGQARAMAQRVDDAAFEVPPGRMTKDQIREYSGRLADKAEANARAGGYRTIHEAQGAGAVIGGERRSMFTARTVTPVDRSGQSMLDVSRALSPEQRGIARAAVDREQAIRQTWRSTPMDKLMTGRQTLAELEEMSGRKLTRDEIVDASREANLGVIDEDKEREFDRWWGGDRKPMPEAAEAPRAAAAEPAMSSATSAKAVREAEDRATREHATDLLARLKAKADEEASMARTGNRVERGGSGAGEARRAPNAAGEREAAGARNDAGTEQPSRLARIGGLAKRANDVATALQAARSLGIPGIPDPRAIPVVGPLLSLYLKARAARAVWSRLGGRIPATAEAKIAARAARSQDEIARAVDRALGVGARGAAAMVGPAARTAPAIARAVVGTDDRKATTPTAAAALDTMSASLVPGLGGSGTAKPANVNEAASARAAELARAAADPDLVSRLVRQAVNTDNPAMADAIAQVALRKIQYLQSKAPAVPLPDPMGRPPPPVSTAEAMRFARAIRAVEDPLGELRRLADGTLTGDAADAIRNVYPQLFGAIQKRVVDMSAQLGAAVPFRTRLRLSMLLGADLDPSLGHLAALQAGGPAVPADAVTGASGAPPAGPPPPAVASVPNLVSLYQTAADRRSAK